MNTLNRAVKVEDVDEVRRLVAQGHDVNTRDDHGETPVMIAASRGNTAILRVLIDAGANPNVARPGDWSPLARATAAGSHAAVLFLLERGADPMASFGQATVATFIRNQWPDRSDILQLLSRGHDTGGSSAV